MSSRSGGVLYPYPALNRGDLVKAARRLDPEGANVRRGTRGVVFEEANAYGDGGGPMVRWFTGTMCNVYVGDVLVADSINPEHAAVISNLSRARRDG